MGLRWLVSLVLAVVAARPGGGAPESKPGLWIIEAEGAAVGVLGPPGWLGEINGLDVDFWRSGETYDRASSTIRVQLETRAEKSRSDNFGISEAAFRSQFPALESAMFELAHPAYRSTSKLFTVPEQFYEYVVYVCPKKRGPVLFRASINTKHRPATPDDMSAFTLVVRSLVLLAEPKR